MSDVETALGTGGTYGIAGAIVFAAVKLGPIAARIYQVLYAIWEQREILIEQEARRDTKRRRAESSQPPTVRHSKMPSLDAVPRDEFSVHENTDVVSIREDVRKRGIGGLRLPQPGKHHDGEG